MQATKQSYVREQSPCLLQWDNEVTCMRGEESWRPQEVSMHPTFSFVRE